MTPSQSRHAAGQLRSFSDLGQLSESPSHTLQESSQNRKNGLVLKGLSPAKAYLEGCLLIAVLFKSRAGVKRNCGCIACYDCDPGYPTASFDGQIINMGVLGRGKQDHMLVRDVQNMEMQEVRTLPSRERLYVIKDDFDNFVAGPKTRFCMSLDGTFKVLPSAIFGEGEFDMLVDGAAIDFDKDTVSVIQGGSEVMEGIPQDRRRMARETAPDCVRAFPWVTIAVGLESIFVRTDVLPENLFEVVDVMFGPFGL